MRATILFWLLSGCLVAWVYTLMRQARSIRRLERWQEEIQVEETLVFDLLHGLGEALSESIRPAALHRLIGEGASRGLGARGGALYLTDRTGTKLVPTFVSKGCPPLVDVPPHILQQTAGTPVALENFLRVHNIGNGEGVLGRVWQAATPLCLNEFSEAPELATLRDSSLGATSVMVAPLLYAKQNMGVLALANSRMGSPFSQNDFVVLKSISEQSAFALYNAIIYSEANEKKRLDHDLAIARDIQRILLPAEAPIVNGFEISGMNVPARPVSGDSFDYIKVGEESLGVALADVSGKGIPASLIMAICRSVLRSQAIGNPSPADVLQKVNRQLYPDIKEYMFISTAYLVLDHARDGVTLAPAGHDAPLLYKPTSQPVAPLKTPLMVVGTDSADVFDWLTTDVVVGLERDDCILLYTDGITEALDNEGNEFGLERTIASVQSSAKEGAQAMVTRLIDDLRNFVGSTPQNDDITMIAIRKT